MPRGPRRARRLSRPEPQLAPSPDLPAGDFAPWLRAMRAALQLGHDADVPCGDCCACCTTAHFVHIGAAEADTLAHVPPALLFSAPGHAPGTVLMGHDERGHCPLLEHCLCSIYEHRPLTCRVYDCRVFAAAGIDADRDEITRRVRRWAFGHPTQRDRDEHAAVRTAARFVRRHAALLPPSGVPRDPPRLAVLAVTVSDAFLPARRATRDDRDGPGAGELTDGPGAGELTDDELARRVLDAARRLMRMARPPGAS